MQNLRDQSRQSGKAPAAWLTSSHSSWNDVRFSSPTPDNAETVCVVSLRVIGAVRVDPSQPETPGMFCQLAPGSELTIVGKGFDSRTVLVSSKERFYFVFCADLPLPTTAGPSLPH